VPSFPALFAGFIFLRLPRNLGCHLLAEEEFSEQLQGISEEGSLVQLGGGFTSTNKHVADCSFLLANPKNQ
jgi:hypothetical protein